MNNRHRAVVTRPNWETTGSAAIGLVIHMMFTAALVVAFGLLVATLNLNGMFVLAIAGMAVGVVDWVVARYVVLPAVDRFFSMCSPRRWVSSLI